MRRKVFVRRIVATWPFWIWASVAVIAFWGYQNTREEFKFAGRVQKETVLVASPDDSRVAEVAVLAGQSIKSGTTLAKLDTSRIDLQLEELKLEIQQEHRERERRYLEARQRLVEQRQDLVLRQTKDEALLKVLGDEQALLQDLNARRLIERAPYVDTLATAETLRSALQTYPSLLEEVEFEMAQLEASRAIWDIEDPQLLIQQDDRIALLKRQREAMALVSERSGIVSEVLKKPGEIVQMGEPVIRLVLDSEPIIVGFIPETTIEIPQRGDHLQVTTPTLRGKWITVNVTEVAPNIVTIPDRVSSLPGRIISGRYCYLTPLQAVPLLDGESVLIRRERPGFFNFLKKLKDVDAFASAAPASSSSSED